MAVLSDCAGDEGWRKVKPFPVILFRHSPSFKTAPRKNPDTGKKFAAGLYEGKSKRVWDRQFIQLSSWAGNRSWKRSRWRLVQLVMAESSPSPSSSCCPSFTCISFQTVIPMLFVLLAVMRSLCFSCQPWMRCPAPQKCLSFCISSQESWNNWLLCKHLSCSHLETLERWHQPQHSASDGFMEKGSESRTAEGLEAFPHSAAGGTTLFYKDQAFAPCLQQFIKEPATQLFSFHCWAQYYSLVFLPLVFFSTGS